ncbi:MAG TPA: HPF/RaiA family ribosome-associated protein [Terracidiphilus sp.]
MEMEFTSRQGKVTKALRKQAEEGMERIGRILGRTARVSVTFDSERHLHVVELTVRGRAQQFAAEGKAPKADAALRQALSHAEAQARRYRDRRIVGKRLPISEKVISAPPLGRPKSRAASPESMAEAQSSHNGNRPRASIAVHSFPAKATVVEPHVVKNGDAFALGPMTIEQAVKDAEFRDRDLLIFRTPASELYVLHRRRDGQMELVEIPL